jgi:hypothetical protein
MALTLYTIIMAIAVLFSLGFLSRDMVKSFVSLQKPVRNLFLSNLVVYLCLFVILWPGLADGDFTYVFTDLRRGYVHVFQGAFFSGYVNIWHALNLQFFVPGLIQIFFTQYIFLNFLNQMPQQPSVKFSYLVGLAFLFILSPLTVGITLFYSRDSFLALTLTALAIYIFKNYYSDVTKKLYATTKATLALVVLVYLVSSIRQEGLVLFLFAIPVAWFYALISLKYCFRLCGLFLAVYLVFGFSIPAITDDQRSGSAHIATTFLNPLGEVLNKIDYQNIDPIDLQNIKNVADLSCFKKYFDPFEIMPFHNKCVHIDDVYFQQFMISSMKVLIQYPGIFLKNRVRLFLNASNIIKCPGTIFTDDNHYVNWDTLERIQTQTEYSNSFASKTYSVLLASVTTKYHFIRIVFFSLLMPMAFSMLMLFSKYSNPFLKTFSALLLGRLVVVALLSPAAYLKYYHVNYFAPIVFGLILIPAYLPFLKKKIVPDV